MTDILVLIFCLFANIFLLVVLRKYSLDQAKWDRETKQAHEDRKRKILKRMSVK